MSRNRSRQRDGAARQQQNGNGNGNGSAPRERKAPKPDRVWTAGEVRSEDGYLMPDVDREDVVQALTEIETMGHRLGHAYTATPIRVDVGEDEFGTRQFKVVGWRFEQHKGIPAVTMEQFVGLAGLDEAPGDDRAPVSQDEMQAAYDALPDDARAAVDMAVAAATEGRDLTPEEREVVQAAEAQLQPVEEPVDPTAGRPVEVEPPSAAAAIARAG